MHEAIGASSDGGAVEQASRAWSVFERALSAVRIAREACDTYDREVLLPIIQEQEAGRVTIEEVHTAEEAWTPYTTAYADATDALLLTPAPSFETLLAKVTVACEALDLGDAGNLVMQGLANDLRRLIKGGGAA